MAYIEVDDDDDSLRKNRGGSVTVVTIPRAGRRRLIPDRGK